MANYVLEVNATNFQVDTDTFVAKLFHIPNACSIISLNNGTYSIGDTDTFALNYSTFSPLTDNSMADTLHRHSELSASDETPDRALVVNALGNVGIGTTSPTAKLNIVGATNSTTGFIVNANVGITGNYSVGNCWMAYSGGINYGTNCSAI